MRAIRLSGAFKRDLRRIERRQYRIDKLNQIADMLRAGTPLPLTCRPHPLKGDWKGFHECHVSGDWLLIYQVTDDELLLARTGTHSDLFDE